MNSISLRLYIVVVAACLLTPANVFAATDCDCPEVKCSPCEFQDSISFYTEKCGGGAKTKSCARPSCLPLDPLPANCPAAKANASTLPMQQQTDRAPASEVPAAQEVKAVSAKVIFVAGKVWLTPAKTNQKAAPLLGQALFEGDALETLAGSKVAFAWNNGNEVILPQNSKLVLRAYINDQNTKKTLMDLIKGQVRSQVKEKLTLQTDSYEVRTPTAVAGVRGTDFIVEYSDSDRLVTSVQTVTGAVVLASRDKEQEVSIPAGYGSSFVVNDESSSVFSDQEVNSFVHQGFLTPVYKMSSQDIAKIKTTYSDPENRAIASEDRALCDAPVGSYNQCAWNCANNPKGEKSCRTDLPSVRCERKRCNANGKWSDLDRLPASFGIGCPAEGFKVAPCDY